MSAIVVKPDNNVVNEVTTKVEQLLKKENNEVIKYVVKTKQKYRYVILCESNDDEMEQWYYFIKLNGNEKALQHLQKQLEQIEMILEEGMSTFDLDLDHTFSEQTASEMIRLEINTHFHRKFDGKLKMINFKLKDKNSNLRMLEKCTKVLGGWSSIEEYVSGEEEVTDAEYVEEESGSEESCSEESESEESESDESEEIVKMEAHEVPTIDSNTKNTMLFPVPVEWETYGVGRHKKNNKH